jgi:hypothetical protein|tara:strand:+ start:384 stop:797 length:414 start_codon:yes stop_codon:yes gene_type:complete
MAEDIEGLYPRLIRTFIKIRDARSEVRAAWEEEDAKLEAQLNIIKEEMLEYFKRPENKGATNFSSAEGQFIRMTKTKYFTDDWKSFHEFIVEEQVPELLEKRVAQGAMKQYLEENPDKLPKGLNTVTEYTIQVRKKK